LCSWHDSALAAPRPANASRPGRYPKHYSRRDLQLPGAGVGGAIFARFSGLPAALAGYRRNFAASVPETSGKPRAIRAPLLPTACGLFILRANAVQR
jgi:hypothetical protein